MWQHLTTFLTTNVTTRDDILTTFHDDQEMTKFWVTSTDDMGRHRMTASGNFYRQSQKLPVLQVQEFIGPTDPQVTALKRDDGWSMM